VPYKDPEKQKEHNRERARKRQRETPEKNREAAAKWRRNHPERAKDSLKRYRAKHPRKKTEETRRRYYLKNKIAIDTKVREWQLAHPENMKVIQHRRVARRAREKQAAQALALLGTAIELTK